MKRLLAPALASALLLGAPAAHAEVVGQTPMFNNGISLEDVEVAQRDWGQRLIEISVAHDEKGMDAARKLAEDAIDTAYGYTIGPVLFKPTLASAPHTFRITREGALSYFVGGNPDYPEDKGFALKSWRKYEFHNAALFVAGNTATTMGTVTLTDKDGKVTTVDKTWQFYKDSKGKMRIVLHHSSLPYTPEK